MDLDVIRKLIVISLFSDDEFLDILVLKGGNAINLAHGSLLRASLDLDFSLTGSFPESDSAKLTERITTLLQKTMHPEGYHPFDVRVRAVPPNVSPDIAHFWGGYVVELKVIALDAYARLHNDPQKLRKMATDASPTHRKTFVIDISKYEWCPEKQETELEGYTIFVYTPTMIVAEKLRAICQQMPEYRKHVRSSTASARARDFFDIHTLVERFSIDLTSERNKRLLREVFEAKRVPLRLLGDVRKFRDFHRADFRTIEDTAPTAQPPEPFDFYFDYVLGIIDRLKPLWKE